MKVHELRSFLREHGTESTSTDTYNGSIDLRLCAINTQLTFETEDFYDRLDVMVSPPIAMGADRVFLRYYNVFNKEKPDGLTRVIQRLLDAKIKISSLR